MGWTEIQTAICTWLSSQTGIAAASVIAAEQPGPRPAKPYATFMLTGPIALGAFDSVVKSNRSPIVAGAEVQLTVKGEREIGASIQIYSDVVGSSSAIAMAAKAQTALRLPSVASAINAAGLSVIEAGPVRNLAGINKTTQEGRAQFDARFATRHELVEYTGYIATLAVTDTVAARVIPVPAT